MPSRSWRLVERHPATARFYGWSPSRALLNLHVHAAQVASGRRPAAVRAAESLAHAQPWPTPADQISQSPLRGRFGVPAGDGRLGDFAAIVRDDFRQFLRNWQPASDRARSGICCSLDTIDKDEPLAADLVADLTSWNTDATDVDA